jgi:glycyl-tRNA synthetase alpha chain
MGRVRDLANGSCQAWIEKNQAAWEAKYPGWTV